MSTSKSIDKICIIAVILTIVVSILFCNSEAFGVQRSERVIGYEGRLFDNSRVHTIDIVIDDWDSFLSTCENEEYAVCSAVIDNEAYRNIAIRAKGNTSLSSVKQSGSSRYSFKIEFDHFDSTKTYHGLDKLCLNNIIQDNSYMKDYLAYTLMKQYGADAPLCSYAYITVNGEDWGLYLAVEAVEDTFLQRNYGTDYGELYKPDSLSFGGGRGNGKDFDMQEFIEENSEETEDSSSSETSDNTADNSGSSDNSGSFSFPQGGMPDMSNMPAMSGFDPNNMPEGMTPPDGFDPSSASSDSSDRKSFGGMPGGGGFGGFGGMGSGDVKLQYIDDDPDSYSNIFNSAKTDITEADKMRLINSLKTLSEGGDVSSAVDIDEVIRYFAVHVFLCNGDSYTGMMVHNYYLYEDDGRLSMIPWDYNLAYGSFQGSDATSSVNSPIDTPVSGGMSDRPMIAWIFNSEEYTKMYHDVMSELVGNTDFAGLIDSTYKLIAEYVEKDPTKFCTYEDFEKGVAAIKQFCTLRAESVKGQLDGTIPATSSGQQADSSALIDAFSLTISDMGSMGGGNGGGMPGGGFGGFGGKTRPDRNGSDTANTDTAPAATSGTEAAPAETSGSAAAPSVSADNINVVSSKLSMSLEGSASSGFGGGRPGGNMPGGFDPSSGFGGNMPEGFDPSSGFGGGMPEGFDPSSGFGGGMPEGFDPSSGFGGSMPEGFDPSSGFGGGIPGGAPGNAEVTTGSEAATTEAPETEATAASEAETTTAPDTGAATVPEAQTSTAADTTAAPETTSSGERKKPEGSDFDGKRPDMTTADNSTGGTTDRSSFSSFGSSRSTNTGNADSIILLGVSAGVLLIGIAFAALYKR